MSKKSFRAFLTLSALSVGVTAGVGSIGCVASRDARNGVFNENQYLRKDFLVRDGDGAKPDNGWLIKATVTEVNSPNMLGGMGLEPSEQTNGELVRFDVTADKLRMVSMREVYKRTEARTDSVLNSWPITNVDLKYRVNLDGETTNFYEENQENNWQDRQWVKINLNKNDLSDLALYHPYTIQLMNLCTDAGDATATLVPGSFKVDEPNDYVQWKVNITVPVKILDTACQTLFTNLGIANEGTWSTGINHPNASFNILYSMVRAKPLGPEACKDANGKDVAGTDCSYQPLELAEKDPIRHKYGYFETYTMAYDADTGLLASRELMNRYNPNKDVVYYFTQDVPDYQKKYFTGAPDSMDVTTNAIFDAAGMKGRLKFLNADDDKVFNDHARKDNPREFGDIRYSFVRWIADPSIVTGYAGITQFAVDPRTGETISASITAADHNYRDSILEHVDAYLRSLGASEGIDLLDDKGVAKEWTDPGACKEGATMPLNPKTKESTHNQSSLFQKMQQYLQKPQPTFGNLGPTDFVQPQDTDFFRAFYALLPYEIFNDPAANPFVIPEGGAGVYGPAAMYDLAKKEAEFRDLTAKIDRGESPYEAYTGAEGMKNATAFLNHMRDLTINHRNFNLAVAAMPWSRMKDPVPANTMETVLGAVTRRCIGGKWETKQEWIDNRLSSWWESVYRHEFGHSLGLRHNFMGSIDRPNQKPGMYTSSIMEYPSRPVDLVYFNQQGAWGTHDEASLAFLYANSKRDDSAGSGTSITGQLDPTKPWKDPKGFAADGKTELGLLFCTDDHVKYTPFCRTFDYGSTPSEIIASAIEQYEVDYKWRNYRVYRKFWNDANYAAVADSIPDMRRFLLSWEYDWSTSELADTFRRIGINNPDPKGSNLQYYTALGNKFNADASMANQMVAAFSKAIIQQSAGERPYRTVYDKFYGDVTQQGIILDKFFAMQGFVGLWPGDSYDPNQAGTYFASYSGVGDASYRYVAEDAVTSMIGGQYDVYPYFVPLAVAQFAQDTHSPSFFGRIEVRDWIGGHVFYREQDFLDYFRAIAVANNLKGCTSLKDCAWDPRSPDISDTHNEFFGPDKRQWIWAYIPDRNQWVAVQKERNTASYVIVRNYNDYVVFQLDDGAFPGGAYGALLPMKYFLDAFNTYN